MLIDNPSHYRTSTELDVMADLLPLEGARVLELGCGRAWMTRHLAENHAVEHIIATDVDHIQHEKNLSISDLPNVSFVFGGAEAIAQPDASIDIVLMLKSLHHVPADLMITALAEISRVLKPGGLAYISEPVYRGDFNEILSLFNDEKIVRIAAFEAIKDAVASGMLESAAEYFFESPGHFTDWDDFEQRIINVTHTDHAIDADLYAKIKSAFMLHMGADGAHFLRPSRVNLLRKR
jgi:ubiquinone/menaquinone biosynthesis C-methylase UbiE